MPPFDLQGREAAIGSGARHGQKDAMGHEDVHADLVDRQRRDDVVVQAFGFARLADAAMVFEQPAGLVMGRRAENASSISGNASRA